MLTLNSQGKTLHSTKPLIMGILNVTPDSFYQKSRVIAVSEVLDLAGKMLHEGASILDIGGQSTRPGSEAISANEELDRIGAVIEAVVRHFGDAFISVDTYHSEVAKEVVNLGAHIINDISGGQYDANMYNTIADLNVPYVVMHVNEHKEQMHTVHTSTSILPVVHEFFTKTIAVTKESGIQQLIIDPGFGFSKTPEQNFELIANLSSFTSFQKPILIGVSRKSTIYKTLGITAAEALNGTTVLHTAAILNGASILRVHDVKEANEVVTLCSYLQ
ncbi:MAG: dihydropteroate synthase [Sediminibacterium sp.]|nr:dihydropteroate synthase [Sediminibacterium sp.]